MIDREQLDKMKDIEAGGIAPEELVDLAEVKVTGETAAERLESFLSQIRNPYCCKVGKTPVRFSFVLGAAPLEDKLKAYFVGLKQNAFGAQINP